MKAANGDRKLIEQARALVGAGKVVETDAHRDILLRAGRAILADSEYEPTAADRQILVFLDGSLGARRWLRDRDPWPWEREGSDPEGNKLFRDLDGALEAAERKKGTTWSKRDALAVARESKDPVVVAVATKELNAAIKDWEAADEVVSRRRAQLTEWQLRVQDRYRVQAAKAAR